MGSYLRIGCTNAARFSHPVHVKNENTVLFLQVINEVGQESGYPHSTQIRSRVYKKLIARRPG